MMMLIILTTMVTYLSDTASRPNLPGLGDKRYFKIDPQEQSILARVGRMCQARDETLLLMCNKPNV
jgi:hypothetical protein